MFEVRSEMTLSGSYEVKIQLLTNLLEKDQPFRTCFEKAGAFKKKRKTPRDIMKAQCRQTDDNLHTRGLFTKHVSRKVVPLRMREKHREI